MNIESEKPKMIFRRENDKGVFYSIGLSKKDKDGNYIHGYMNCRFPKEATIEDQTRIIIREAWLDFYLKDKITNPYIFISKYEIVENETPKEPLPQNSKSEYDNDKSDITINDNDLPF